MRFTLRHIYLWEALCVISLLVSSSSPFFCAYGLSIVLSDFDLLVGLITFLVIFPLGIAITFLIVFPTVFFIYCFASERRKVDFDRAFFLMEIPQASAEQTVKVIERRIFKNRFAVQRKAAANGPSIITTRRTLHFFHDIIISSILLYQEDLLDLPKYNSICSSAKYTLRHLPSNPQHSKWRTQKKAFVVCIVVNRMAEGMTDKVKRIVELGDDEVMCCAIDVSQGHVIVNGGWFVPTDILHYCQRLIARVVLGRRNRRLPRFGNHNYTAERAHYLEMLESLKLWDALKTGSSLGISLVREHIHNKRVARRLQDGEIMLLNDILFYKKGARIAEVNCLPDMGNARRMMLSPMEKWEWYYPRRNPMSKEDKNGLRVKIEAYLAQNGFSFYYDKE